MNYHYLILSFLFSTLFFCISYSLVSIFTPSNTVAEYTNTSKICGLKNANISNNELKNKLSQYKPKNLHKNKTVNFINDDSLFFKNKNITKLYENDYIGLFFIPNLVIQNNVNNKIIKLIKALNYAKTCHDESIYIIRTRYLCLINSVINNKFNNNNNIFNILSQIEKKEKENSLYKIYIVLRIASNKNSQFKIDFYAIQNCCNEVNIERYKNFTETNSSKKDNNEENLTNDDDKNNEFFCDLNK